MKPFFHVYVLERCIITVYGFGLLSYPGGPNNPRYRFWYDLKNSAFQYDQSMAKYPFDIRF